MLDDRAKARYRSRLGELEVEIDEAVGFHDTHRTERLHAEREALVAS